MKRAHWLPSVLLVALGLLALAWAEPVFAALLLVLGFLTSPKAFELFHSRSRGRVADDGIAATARIVKHAARPTPSPFDY